MIRTNAETPVSGETLATPMHRWQMAIAKFVAAPWLFFLGPTRVFGRTNVPKTGGLLIFSNHLSSLDPILIQWACRRHVFFMAEEELFEMPGVKWVAKTFQAFPVKQNSPDRGALRRAHALLSHGHSVCIFPEGGLSPAEDLGELKGGAGLVLKNWMGPTIFAQIEGSRRALPYGSMKPRPAFRWITVRWGQTQTPPEGGVPEQLAWINDQLRSS